MKCYFFNDKNLTIMDKNIIQGFQMLRGEVIIRLYTKYGAVDLGYDSLDVLIEDYDSIAHELKGVIL